MKSPVYFCPIQHIPEKLTALVEESGVLAPVKPGRRIGIKVHFGEDGNDNYIPPAYIREIIRLVKQKGGKPVLVETTTLYRGRRQHAKSHKQLAYEHGFLPRQILAPIAIVDGGRSGDYAEVPVGLKHVKRAKLAKGIDALDYLVSCAHVKGHMLSGFGGAVKNLAMGLAAKGGKLEMHSSSKPTVAEERCEGCGQCIEYCPRSAISLPGNGTKSGRAAIDRNRCVGCAGCLAACPKNAIRIGWDGESVPVQEKMAEYCYAVLRRLPVGAVNFLMNITPNCDCFSVTEKPFMADVGVMASTDPIACDQAALDRIASRLKKVHPTIDPAVQLEYSERLGIGRRDYRMIAL